MGLCACCAICVKFVMRLRDVCVGCAIFFAVCCDIFMRCGFCMVFVAICCAVCVAFVRLDFVVFVDVVLLFVRYFCNCCAFCV